MIYLFMKRIFVIVLFLSFLASCEKPDPYTNLKDFNKIAEQYVKLVLMTGKYNADYIDAYYGPENLRKDAKEDTLSLQGIQKAAENLLVSLKALDVSQFKNLQKLRQLSLQRRIEALIFFVDMQLGKKYSFDKESQALYNAVSPIYNIKIYDEILEKIDALLPGRGELSERFEAYRKKFIIPPDKIDTVFKTAIAECRRRTLEHYQLPDGEQFNLELVKGQPWGAYNWFKGNARSLIQINCQLPSYIDRVISLACHEGYPGHHVFHTLTEQEFYQKRHWLEFSVYPLFSPISMLSEGMANYAIELAFPGNEKNEYEKKVLCPLAGIKSADLEKYHEILDLIKKLDYADNEVARRYLDGNMSKEHAIDWLKKYLLMSELRAEQHLKFIEKYRSYVITYNVGENLIKFYIDKNDPTGDINRKWDLFKSIILQPPLPEELGVRN